MQSWNDYEIMKDPESLPAEITLATFSLLKSNLATRIMQQLSYYKAATRAWSLIVVSLNKQEQIRKNELTAS